MIGFVVFAQLVVNLKYFNLLLPQQVMIAIDLFEGLLNFRFFPTDWILDKMFTFSNI